MAGRYWFSHCSFKYFANASSVWTGDIIRNLRGEVSKYGEDGSRNCIVFEIEYKNEKARWVAGFFEVPSRFELLYTVLQTVA